MTPQAEVSSPPLPGARAAPDASARTARTRLPRELLTSSETISLGVCTLLAIISAIALSWVPSSDPWAWIDWGQSVARHAPAINGGPSWKPFPAVFTTLFAAFGGAAPKMWLIVPRAAGLLALVAAFRLGRKFAGVPAGIVAAVTLCLMEHALFYFARGTSEPIVAALVLWSIDRHLAGSHRVGYFLVFLATLNRPEISLFLLLDAAYLWLRVPRSRALALAGLILVPVAWLGPPWIVTGNAFQAQTTALGGKGSPGSALGELASSSTLMTLPTLVLAAVALLFAYRRRDRVLLWMAAGIAVWALMMAVQTQIAFGTSRYLLPAGAIVCVLAGIGLVEIGSLVAHAGARLRPAVRLGVWPIVAVGAIALVATLPWTIPRVRAQVNEAHDADLATFYQQRLFLAVDRAGGKRRVLPCHTSIVAINHTVASQLAWKLHVPLRRVRPLMRGTGFVFSAPHTSVTGTTPPIGHPSRRTIRLIASVPPWRVLEVTRRGASPVPRCRSA